MDASPTDRYDFSDFTKGSEQRTLDSEAVLIS